MYRHKVVIDPRELIGVYSDSPGYVDTVDERGELMRRREATEEEALSEQWMQRLEAAILKLEVTVARIEKCG